jgi:hypothetical protein
LAVCANDGHVYIRDIANLNGDVIVELEDSERWIEVA